MAVRPPGQVLRSPAERAARAAEQQEHMFDALAPTGPIVATIRGAGVWRLLRLFVPEPAMSRALNPHLHADLADIVKTSLQKYGSNAHYELATIIKQFGGQVREVIVEKVDTPIRVVMDDYVPGGVIVKYNLYEQTSVTHIAPERLEPLMTELENFAVRTLKVLKPA